MKSICMPFSSRLRLGAMCSLVVVTCSITGCHSKGEFAGKVTVQGSKKLTDLGVTVKDWGYADKVFSFKLEASKDFGSPWLLTVEADNGQPFSFGTPVTIKAGKSEWIEVGGPKFLDHF